MSVAPVRLLVLGAGSRGSAYADWARRHPERARVVAVADPRGARRDALADAHGVPADARFDGVDAALAALCGGGSGGRAIDAVVVTTPDRAHVEPVLAASARGLDLLVEKPLAPDLAACEAIVEAVESAGVVAAVAHVMRYTAYTRLIERLLAEGAIGEVMALEQLEPVGFWHQAHSYVRGNWRREDEATPMLLAKCCHDLDWMSHVIGSSCTAVSSFGRLGEFTPERRPHEAADRCLDCVLAGTCAYSATRIYLEPARRGERGWPLDVIAWPPTPERVESALRDGPYGRCVWACDNDVVDHQVVALDYASGATATLTMTAFTTKRDRDTRVFGTRGELVGDGETVTVHDFATGETTTHVAGVRADGGIETGHGGGDDGLMDAWITAVAAGDPARVPTSPRETLESHRIAFAAERARHEGTVQRLG